MQRFHSIINGKAGRPLPYLVTLKSMRQCFVFLCITSLFGADSSQWEEKFRLIPRSLSE
jgi:hypothetical protein